MSIWSIFVSIFYFCLKFAATRGPYQQLNITPGIPYYYRVQAYNAFGSSAWSNIARGIGANVTITSTTDDGSSTAKNTVGKLSNALETASQLPGGTTFIIGFNLDNDATILNISGTLPDVAKGIKLVGYCEDGPVITLNGNHNPGLVLWGASLYGLNIINFTGPALKVQKGDNYFSCLKVAH